MDGVNLLSFSILDLWYPTQINRGCFEGSPIHPAAREWGQDCLVTMSGALLQILEATSTWRPSVPSLTVAAVFW